MFKLLIECTKDIDELHINFSDGTTTTVEKPKTPKVENKEKAPKVEIKKQKVDNDYEADADWDSYLGEKNVEKVAPPFIPEIEREVNVAGEMKNAEF